MDSKFIKFRYQCSLERPHALLTKINSEFWSRRSSFLTKTHSCRSTSQKKLQRQNNEDFNNSITLCFATSHQQHHPSPISTKEIFVQPISVNPHTILDFKHHPTQEYFIQMYHSNSNVPILYDILQEIRFSHCQP